MLSFSCRSKRGKVTFKESNRKFILALTNRLEVGEKKTFKIYELLNTGYIRESDKVENLKRSVHTCDQKLSHQELERLTL